MFNTRKLEEATNMFKKHNQDCNMAFYTMYLEEQKNEIYNPENFEKKPKKENYFSYAPGAGDFYSYEKIVRGEIQKAYKKGFKVINVTLNTRGKERFTEQVQEAIHTNTLIALIVKYASEFDITVNFYLPEIDKTVQYVPTNFAYTQRENLYTEAKIISLLKDYDTKNRKGIANSLEELISPRTQEIIEDFVKNSKNDLFFYCHLGEQYYEKLQKRLEEVGISFHTFLCLVNLYFINACIKYGILFSLFYEGKNKYFNQVYVMDTLSVDIYKNKNVQNADDLGKNFH